ncbi:thermonuclease family protein [Brevibacillus fortis]|uniref:thermonuclease family protein n=1 Tax=Brevibacillus fortis TaxID=2126352 RepID=UPI002E2150C3|nr:thermonuclease family protein [Brevibacillus fortis]
MDVLFGVLGVLGFITLLGLTIFRLFKRKSVEKCVLGMIGAFVLFLVGILMSQPRALVAILGFLGFFIFLILTIIMALRKRPAKKYALGILGSVVIFFIGLFMPNVSTENQVSNAASTPGTVTRVSTSTKESIETNNKASEQAPSRIKAKVTEVTDGDTIKVDVDGKEMAIRLLLIDTPETKHPKHGIQPFGKEASKFTKELLTGKAIELEQDVTPGPDKYGRMLYYIYLDGKSVQEQLLEKGLARVAYIYEPNVKYVEQYRAIQEKAQKAGVGIWSIENYAKEDGYHPEAVKKEVAVQKKEEAKPAAPKPASQPTPVPMPQPKPAPAPQPVQEVYYGSCKEAKAAGAAPLYVGDPGYREKLDRDKDGVACE